MVCFDVILLVGDYGVWDMFIYQFVTLYLYPSLKPETLGPHQLHLDLKSNESK